MADTSTEKVDQQEIIKEPFKKPVLIGRVGKLPKKTSGELEKPPEKPKEKAPVPESNSKPAPVPSKEASASIAYKEPRWSGVCPDGSDYALEVLKSGMIVERLDLTQQPFFVFGRLPNCDVVMAHPTISRHHCVLQYKAFAEEDEPPSGWYLFDLGSTHGTYLNKDQLKPSHYTRVRVGHQIKFGNSSRTYILTGPDFDCEGESELTVTEIKQRARDMKLERDRMIREAKEQKEKDIAEQERKREEQGIDWGMGEDAEDETDLSENPFAATTNEELYLTDPKKTLRGYFEREGHELQYDCEERGQGQYLCKVELPMDDARGRPVVAEAIHTGKKKEAVVACALEACRILDRAGLLRQAKHESRRRKERDWSADDFYDSDDDNYLDRTGQVEKKRRVRMERSGVLPEQSAALTYEDLLKQIADIEAKMAAEERTLERLRVGARTHSRADAEGDDLDLYMATLSAPTMSVKAEISTSKMALQKLKSELSKAQRLCELARPAHLPPLVKKEDTKLVKLNSVVYGKRIKLKTDTEKKPTPRKVAKQEEDFVEEVDSDEEDARRKEKDEEGASSNEDQAKELNDAEKERRKQNDTEVKKLDSQTGSKKDSKSKNVDNDDVHSKSESGESEIKSQKSESKSGKSEDSDSKKIYGPMRPPDNYVIPENYFDSESSRDKPEIMEE